MNAVPRRPDPRRAGGNVKGAQRPVRRGRPGQAEGIIERRALALKLRTSGLPYREIARQLQVNVRTAHGDVASELAALREKTVERAEELRTLELQRFDEMIAGLWPDIEAGSPPAVTAAIRVAERRSRLLGLDAPVVNKSEVSGSLGVYAEKLAAERELWLQLDVKQLEVLARESQMLVDRAMEMVRANARALTSADSTAGPASGDGDESSGEEITETATRSDVNDA